MRTRRAAAAMFAAAAMLGVVTVEPASAASAASACRSVTLYATCTGANSVGQAANQVLEGVLHPDDHPMPT